MYVGIMGCCNMYFLLSIVVKKKKKLESHSSNQAVQLPGYPITHSFFSNKGILFGIGCF